MGYKYEDDDDPFKLLEENVNELKSRGLLDGDLTVDDYVNIDFEVCASETSAITNREIVNSILINNYAKEEEETDEESNDKPPKKPKLSESAHAIELLECWSLFDNNGSKIRQSLSLLSKRFEKHSLETKKAIENTRFFQITFAILEGKADFQLFEISVIRSKLLFPVEVGITGNYCTFQEYRAEL